MVLLPVDILSFQGKCNDNYNSIYWTTASETNNDHFVLESSANGTDWKIISIVEGAGNSNFSVNYSVTDENVSSEKSYYRLKQVDFNGDFKYYGPISVSCMSKEIELLNLSPNPASTAFNVNIVSDKENEIKIMMINILGQTVYSNIFAIQNGSNLFTINTDNLDKSVYSFIIESTDGSFKDCRQLIIE